MIIAQLASNVTATLWESATGFTIDIDGDEFSTTFDYISTPAGSADTLSRLMSHYPESTRPQAVTLYQMVQLSAWYVQ